jgi:Tfp pilus assembly PilM family ATPase
LGLDIGVSTVKFVQLQDAGKLTKLVGYGKIDIPQDIIIEGIISEPEKLAEILNRRTRHRLTARIKDIYQNT